MTRTEKIKKWFRKHFKMPLGVKIAICVLPVIITALFYALRSSKDAMDWAVYFISTPIRGFFGLLSSIYPFSIMEVICTAGGVFIIYYIIKSIRDTARRRNKWKLLGKRLLPILVIACYIWGAFCWLWNSGYHASGFAERYDFSGDGISWEELAAVTLHFADKANELAELIERDEDGRYIADRREMFANSVYIYRNITDEFPSLKGKLYAPKPMLYSWLMSITRYSGMYFALTGEAMINTHPPITYMPATVAHEHAHQLGIFAEDEANFVGIVACVTSENIVFEYAGYMLGLNYLLGALMFDSNIFSSGLSTEWYEVINSLSENVIRDRQENAEFWATRTTFDVGVDFISNVLTTVAETTSEAVNTVYDGFLKSQSQELGIRSYGACVDLLVEYFAKELAELT
ncbi:MAG: DUF3810 domain-containing protein [Oscillospiraceae bacterium]|jgi:hypothetical protein|nr:DUF3810 domain-containing protein [Oscillospiraceae bacterium]